MWLRCRPGRAGGFLPCPGVGARVGGWDLPLPPLLCILSEHLEKHPRVPQHSHLVAPPKLLEQWFVGLPCPSQQVGKGTVLFHRPCQRFVCFRSWLLHPSLH